MNEKIKRNQFETQSPLKKIAIENQYFLDNLRKIINEELNEAVIATLPNGSGDLYINAFKIKNIVEKHGNFPVENLIITATEPTTCIIGIIEGKKYITLLYESDDVNYVLSARKFNGHYVVTFFEPADIKYLDSLKRRGEVIFTQKKTP